MRPETLKNQRLLKGENLPLGWSVVEFGSLVRLGNGQVSPLVRPYIDYPHIGPENIEGETGRIVNVRLAREIGLISGKYLFDEKAIVYAKIRPNLNKVCIPGFKGLCSADAYPIWVKSSKVHREYLGHFMRSWLFLYQSVAASMRTGMPKVNRPDLVRFKVLLPPLDEQIRIANLLNAWDKTFDKISRLVDAKIRVKTGLMMSLLGEIHRIEICGVLPRKEFRLGQLFTERDETGCTDLNLLAITADRGVIPRDEVDRKDSSSEDKSKYKRIAPGDIGYNTMRMWQGVSALSKLEGIVSPAYTVCTPNKRVDGMFASYLFKYPPMVHLFHRYSQGMVDDTLSLKFPNFAEIKVAIPSIAEQKRIAAVLSTLDREIDLLKKLGELFKQQKKGLMQLLLTGKVRVKPTTTEMEAAS